MNNLTDGWKNKNKKNREILLFVRDYINIYGTSPTYREVSKHFNSSLGAISNSIYILIEDKLLKKYKSTRLLILTLKGKQMLKNYIPAYEEYQALKEENKRLKEGLETGEISDGYHSFNELYYHRMCLFAVIVNNNKILAWKSKKHADGSMYENFFIVGIETPKGNATYHYQLKYWNLFKCRELEFAPKWDGHTSDDVCERLLTLNFQAQS